jgi:hypothetical protein
MAISWGSLFWNKKLVSQKCYALLAGLMDKRSMEKAAG